MNSWAALGGPSLAPGVRRHAALRMICLVIGLLICPSSSLGENTDSATWEVHTTTTTTNSPVVPEARRLLVNFPCLPCHKTFREVCLKIFGCFYDSDASTTFTSLPSAAVDPSNDGNRRVESETLEPICLPCYRLDWSGRCRKIRTCLTTTITTTATTTTAIFTRDNNETSASITTTTLVDSATTTIPIITTDSNETSASTATTVLIDSDGNE